MPFWAVVAKRRKSSFGGYMKKGIKKLAAIVAVASVIVTSFPIYSVEASTSVVAAGGALAAGNGSSIHDIRASIARNVAKKSVLATHEMIEATDSKIAVEPVNAISHKVPALIDESNITKVETPASKAVNESETIDGVSVVGSASEAAKIEITSTDTDANANSGEKTDVTDEVTEGETAPAVDENVDAANPTIDIKPEAQELAEGEEDLSDRVIADCDGYVNVRQTPDEGGEVVGKLYNHSAGVWLGKEGDWYKIESGNVTGYVKGAYVKTGQAAVKLAAEVGERIAVVTTTTLKIREEASTDSTVLGLVPMEDQLTVLEETDEWVKVSIEEGDGWVSREFVSVSTEFPKAESKAEEEARLRQEEAARRKANAAANKAVGKNSGGKTSSGGGAGFTVGGSGLGSAVANYGLQFVGNPYVYGGTSLTNGTDCSGFTMGVYKNFGVSLPHSSGAQRSCGYGVGSLAEAQPGDLICYSGHVAIYIGGGQIVHASTAATGIKVSNVSYRSILAIRRIF